MMKKPLFLIAATLWLFTQASAQYGRYDVNQDGKTNTADVVTLYNAIINGDDAPVEPLGFPKIFTVNGVGFTMIPVQGGTFSMGATPEQEGVA